mmetsp:Transcript_24230/g.39552  ORF Transcript_24230/g.39552 Transcript_24230/m.39552 type:complete len:266 (-) Transcript_24230:288-1085(-)
MNIAIPIPGIFIWDGAICNSYLVTIVDKQLHDFFIFLISFAFEHYIFYADDVGPNVKFTSITNKKTGSNFGLKNPAWYSSFLRNQIVQKTRLLNGLFSVLFNDFMDFFGIMNEKDTGSTFSHRLLQDSDSLAALLIIGQQGGHGISHQIQTFCLTHVPVYQDRGRRQFQMFTATSFQGANEFVLVLQSIKGFRCSMEGLERPVSVAVWKTIGHNVNPKCIEKKVRFGFVPTGPPSRRCGRIDARRRRRRHSFSSSRRQGREFSGW